MKKTVLILVLAGVALAGAAYGIRFLRVDSKREPEYVTASAEYGPLVETVSAMGIVQPKDLMVIGTELSGRVVEIYPAGEVNQTVEANQPLLKLDDRMARHKLEQAEAAVGMAELDTRRAEAQREAAKIDLDYLNEAFELRLVRTRDRDKGQILLRAMEAAHQAALLRVQDAKAVRAQAQLGLDLTIVRVPVEQNNPCEEYSQKHRYTVLDRKVTFGQMIAPPLSGQLFTLSSDLSRMQVRAQISENDIGKVRTGLPATFTVYAYSEEADRFDARVGQIGVMPAQIRGAISYDAILDAQNDRDPKSGEWKLRPGMSAAVDIVLRRHDQVWKIPTAAFNLQPEDRLITAAAKAKIAQWQAKNDRDDWRIVWTLDSHRKLWPVLVRIGGKNAAGETGINDGHYNEVLDWDPDLQPKPDPRAGESIPKVITAIPTVSDGSLLGRTIKF